MDIEHSSDRRTFFKQAALFGWLGVLLVADRPAAAKPKQALLPEREPSGQGYRLTEHVKKYYETART